ncbi:hypothetical protein Tco_1371175, partial [Tanacetum coccineum]
VPIYRVKDQQFMLNPITQPPVLHPLHNHQLNHHLCKQPMLQKRLLPCPHDSPLPRVHSFRSDEGSMTLHELMVLCTTLSKKVESLESDLKQTKLTYGATFTKLIMRVKRLEKEVKLNKARRRGKIVVSDDEDAEKDTSKQWRKAHSQGSQPEDQLGVFSAAKILVDVARVHTYSKRRRTVSTGSGGISTAEESVSIVGASMPVSTASRDQGSIPLPSISKDKGKVIMTESEPEQATTKLKQRQEIAGYEATIRLQEQLDEDESQRIARDAEGFTDAEWDDILARVVADEDLVQQLQAGEKYSEEDLLMKLVELVNQRKKFFAQQITEAKRNKPMTPTQQKAYMSTYIKNQEGGYSIKQLKLLSFEQVKEIFEDTIRRVQSFVPMDSELEVQRLKRAEKEKKLSQEDLQQLVMIVPVEEVYVEALQVELKRLFEPDVDDILWKL